MLSYAMRGGGKGDPNLRELKWGVLGRVERGMLEFGEVVGGVGSA